MEKTTAAISPSHFWCSHCNTIYDSQLYIFRTQPHQREAYAKDKNFPRAAAAARNLDAAIPLRSANTVLQNAIELHAAAPETAAPVQNRISAPQRKNDDFWSAF